MSEKAQNVQDVFLGHLRARKMPVTVFLLNGVKLQGIIDSFDRFSVVLRRDRHSQLVYKEHDFDDHGDDGGGAARQRKVTAAGQSDTVATFLAARA